MWKLTAMIEARIMFIENYAVYAIQVEAGGIIFYAVPVAL
jgi:hypothetical protein